MNTDPWLVLSLFVNLSNKSGQVHLCLTSGETRSSGGWSLTETNTDWAGGAETGDSEGGETLRPAPPGQP